MFVLLLASARMFIIQSLDSDVVLYNNGILKQIHQLRKQYICQFIPSYFAYQHEKFLITSEKEFEVQVFLDNSETVKVTGYSKSIIKQNSKKYQARIHVKYQCSFLSIRHNTIKVTFQINYLQKNNKVNAIIPMLLLCQIQSQVEESFLILLVIFILIILCSSCIFSKMTPQIRTRIQKNRKFLFINFVVLVFLIQFQLFTFSTIVFFIFEIYLLNSLLIYLFASKKLICLVFKMIKIEKVFEILISILLIILKRQVFYGYFFFNYFMNILLVTSIVLTFKINNLKQLGIMIAVVIPGIGLLQFLNFFNNPWLKRQEQLFIIIPSLNINPFFSCVDVSIFIPIIHSLIGSYFFQIQQYLKIYKYYCTSFTLAILLHIFSFIFIQDYIKKYFNFYLIPPLVQVFFGLFCLIILQDLSKIKNKDFSLQPNNEPVQINSQSIQL